MKKKCWIKVKGTDGDWNVEGEGKTRSEMFQYFVERLTDEVIVKEVKKRKLIINK